MFHMNSNAIRAIFFFQFVNFNCIERDLFSVIYGNIDNNLIIGFVVRNNSYTSGGVFCAEQRGGRSSRELTDKFGGSPAMTTRDVFQTFCVKAGIIQVEIFIKRELSAKRELLPLHHN